MNNKIIYSVVFVGLLFLSLCPLSHVLADGANLTNPLNGVANFGALLTKIAGAVGNLIATIGTIMIIVAGILYLTSAGSPEKIKVAKTALIYAIAGIVIGLAASAIVSIVKDTMGAQSSSSSSGGTGVEAPTTND